MTVQAVSSIARQVLAVAVSIFGVLTANQTVLHLPAWASSILIAFAPVLLTLEHYLGDPSTGTPTKPATKEAAPTSLPTFPTA